MPDRVLGDGNIAGQAMSLARFVAARLIKLAGNSLKAAFYLFHLAAPDKRFVIPARTKPLLPSAKSCRIPRIVWQTNFTDRVTLPVYVNYLVNRLFCAGCEFRFVDDAEVNRFVAAEFPGRVQSLFARLRIGAARSDVWRILVLQRFGGVYLDIDSHLVWPLDAILPDQATELFLQHKDSLTNYFLASTPDNPHLAAIIDTICARIEENASNNVFEITGPGALDHALQGTAVARAAYRQTCYQGTFTNEFFQYLDSPAGKWTTAQLTMRVVAPSGRDDESLPPLMRVAVPPPNENPGPMRRTPWLRPALMISAVLALCLLISSYVTGWPNAFSNPAQSAENPDIPFINLKRTCERNLLGDNDDNAPATVACLQRENAAESVLMRDWTRFSGRARLTCLERLDRDDPGYEELLTCLDIEASARPRQ